MFSNSCVVLRNFLPSCIEGDFEFRSWSLPRVYTGRARTAIPLGMPMVLGRFRPGSGGPFFIVLLAVSTVGPSVLAIPVPRVYPRLRYTPGTRVPAYQCVQERRRQVGGCRPQTPRSL